MGNIIDYVKKMNASFDEAPISCEDALVLSQFCYLKFDGLVEGVGGRTISFEELDALDDRDKLFSEKTNEKSNKELYDALIKSPRFSKIRFGNYVNRIDAANESQFAAITFFLHDDAIFIAFRGTDETMLGWQEDFAMALKKPIMGQRLSEDYLNKVVENVNGQVYIGGHSKGGNLATYAAMCASDTVQDKINAIYSFDGPGFRPEFLDNQDYEELKDRMIKVVPKSSPIGLLLNTPGEYRVIEAKAMGPMQHNPYTWVIKKNRLVTTKVTEQHLLVMKTMNDWLLSLDDEGISNFVSFLCWVLDSTEATTTTEFKEGVAQHTMALIKAGQNSDEAMELASEFVKSYMELASEIVKENAKEKYEAFLAEVTQKKDDMVSGVREKAEEVKSLFEEKKFEIEETVEGKLPKKRVKK